MQGALEVSGSCVLQGENEGREPHVVVDLDEAFREPGRCFDATLGGQQRHGAAQERGIAGVRVQDALEVRGRRSVVAAGVSEAADKITAD